MRVALCSHLLHLFLLLSGGTHWPPLLMYTSLSVQYSLPFGVRRGTITLSSERAAREFSEIRVRERLTPCLASRSRGRYRLALVHYSFVDRLAGNAGAGTARGGTRTRLRRVRIFVDSCARMELAVPSARCRPRVKCSSDASRLLHNDFAQQLLSQWGNPI